MANPDHRWWVATAAYPDKDKFMLGTIVVPTSAAQHEIEAAFRCAWERISPHAMPAIVAMQPGSLVFVGENDAG